MATRSTPRPSAGPSSTATRPAAVYRGNPFQIEAAIGFGGDLPGDQPARVIRFANRVPLVLTVAGPSGDPLADASVRYDGRENVVVVARKPAESEWKRASP